MHCIILLPDAAGRVPTAQELRQRGFSISAAVEVPGPPLAAGGTPALQGQTSQAWSSGLALAAEEPAAYGEPRHPEL
jgi:hypothetical protein